MTSLQPKDNLIGYDDSLSICKRSIFSLATVEEYILAREIGSTLEA